MGIPDWILQSPGYQAALAENPLAFTPEAQAARFAEARARSEAAAQAQQAQIAQQRAARQAAIEAQYGQYQGYNRAAPTYADWYNADLTGVDWGELGQGYQGPARLPNSEPPTGRFDWETPGAGLAFSQLSNAEAANAFHRGAMMHGNPAFEGAANGNTGGFIGSPASAFLTGPDGRPNLQTLPNGQTYYDGVTPEQAAALSRMSPESAQYYDAESQRMYASTPQNSNSYIADALEMGYSLDELRQMGPALSARVFDDVIAMRESKNQRPKRGLQVGPFNISPGLIAGGLFAAPFALAGAGGVGAAGGAAGATTSFLGTHPLLAGALPGAIAGAGSGDPLSVLTGGLGGALNAAGGLGGLFQGIPQDVLDAIQAGLGGLALGELINSGTQTPNVLPTDFQATIQDNLGGEQNTADTTPPPNGLPIPIVIPGPNTPGQPATPSIPQSPESLSNLSFLRPIPLVEDPSSQSVLANLNQLFKNIGLT